MQYAKIYAVMQFIHSFIFYPPGKCMFKVSNRNTCKICSKLTIKTPERRHWRRSGVFIVDFEHISHFFLVFLLLTMLTNVSTVDKCLLGYYCYYSTLNISTIYEEIFLVVFSHLHASGREINKDEFSPYCQHHWLHLHYLNHQIQFD